MKGNFTLRSSVIVLAVLSVLIAAIGYPILSVGLREKRELAAKGAMGTLAMAEADFRSNDRDGNLINDFWTGDVAGLYFIVPQKANGDPPAILDEGHAIKLMERDVAEADGDFGGNGLFYSAKQHLAPATFAPRRGYHFVALVDDMTDAVATHYHTDTDASTQWGLCHHLDRFGFMAFPVDLSSGSMAFTINEENTIFRFQLTEPYSASVENVRTSRPTRTVIRGYGTSSDARYRQALNDKCFPDNPMRTGIRKID